MRKKTLILILCLVPLVYTGLYAALRIGRYFVRQEFVCFSCGEAMTRMLEERYPSDALPVREGHTSHTWESERTQIGCGRIQKGQPYAGESLLLPLFQPLGELELSARGFRASTLRVYQHVSEFERYSADSNKVYFARSSPVAELQISRREQ